MDYKKSLGILKRGEAADLHQDHYGCFIGAEDI